MLYQFKVYIVINKDKFNIWNQKEPLKKNTTYISFITYLFFIKALIELENFLYLLETKDHHIYSLDNHFQYVVHHPKFLAKVICNLYKLMVYIESTWYSNFRISTSFPAALDHKTCAFHPYNLLIYITFLN